MKIAWKNYDANLSSINLTSIKWDTNYIVTDDGVANLFLIDSDTGITVKKINLNEKIIDIDSGDIDGDSIKELLLVTSKGILKICDKDLNFDVVSFPFPAVKVMSKDFNDNGIDEVVVIDSTATLNLWSKEEGLVHRITATQPIMFIHIGDLSNDLKNIMILIYGGRYYDLYSMETFEIIHHAELFLEGLKRVRMFDINDDGINELVFLRGNSILYMGPKAKYLDELLELPYDNTIDFEISDIDGDGKPEIIVIGSREKRGVVSVFTIYGDLIFEENVKKVMSRIYLADINGDGLKEYVLTSAYGDIALFDSAGLIEEFVLEEEILRTLVSDLDNDSVDEIYLRTKRGVLCLKRF